MMLNLLCLIVVAYLHLLTSQSLKLLLKSLLLISKGFQCHNHLFDFILPLLQHFLHLFILTIQSFSLSSAILFVPSGIFNLTVLDLNQFSQIVIFLLQSFVLGADCFLLLFGLHNTCLILLLLFTEFSDFAL